MTPEERADEICDRDGYAKWRHIVSAIRAACAERDRQVVEWVRTHHGDDWMPRALEAYLAQNGGGK